MDYYTELGRCWSDGLNIRMGSQILSPVIEGDVNPVKVPLTDFYKF